MPDAGFNRSKAFAVVEAEFVGSWMPCENVKQFLREKSWRPPQEEGRLIVCSAALSRDILGMFLRLSVKGPARDGAARLRDGLVEPVVVLLVDVPRAALPPGLLKQQGMCVLPPPWIPYYRLIEIL